MTDRSPLIGLDNAILKGIGGLNAYLDYLTERNACVGWLNRAFETLR